MKKNKAASIATSEETQRRLSPWRVMLAIFMIAAIAYSTFVGWDRWQDAQVIATQEPWFAAYVDATSTPTYAFEQLGSTSTPNVVLSFIVSSTSDACTPTWGGFYTLEQASTSLDLDRRIARLQQQGGRVAISFGGALNNEIALNCEDPDTLSKAYRSVIERYNIDTIDLDLENHNLSNTKASKRRSMVIAQLQKNRAAEGKNLAVWLTLPVAPQGLTPDGTNAVAQMLAEGVDLAGINVMTMNYGDSKAQGQSMLKASERALVQTHRQLGVLYNQAGINLNKASLWRKLGATPMIGQNDVAGEIFTYQDALGLNLFALNQGVGRMSIWSANRDVPCGENYVDLHIVSDSCSGLPEEEFSFANALSKDFLGDLTQNSSIVTAEDPASTVQVIDDPEKSPYQIWKETGAYLKGTKVVWHGNVYEAKWWTKGDTPDNPVLQSWETPWQIIGPVLPGEKPVQQPTLPAGTYPIWSGSTIYQAGQRVLFDKIPFEAKWWNQGQSPAASASNADNSPWTPLTHQQIEQVLEQINTTNNAT